MKRRWILLLLCVLCMLQTPSLAQSEGTFTIGGFSELSEGYQMLHERYPDATITCVSLSALSTEELVSSLLTKNFNCDLFSLTTNAFNLHTLAERGYCADLSANPDVMALVERMYPSVQNEIVWNGQVFALPYACSLDYLAYNPETWASAGLSESDIPGDFSAFLDFLERWVLQAEGGAEPPCSIFADFDETLYTGDSYAVRLLELLMKQHLMQQSFADSPLDFRDEAFRTLAERCVDIGHRLYQVEPLPNTRPPLFHFPPGTSMADLPYLIPLRLNDQQPVLINATMNVMVIHSESDATALAMEFAVYQAQHYQDGLFAAFLFRDASAIENPMYASDVATWQKRIAETQTRLEQADELTPEARNELEAQLTRYEAALVKVSDDANRFLITEEDLAVYRQYGECFYFQPPSVFDPATEDGQTARKLCARYASGGMTLDQFINRLDEMAWMIQMETSSSGQ